MRCCAPLALATAVGLIGCRDPKLEARVQQLEKANGDLTAKVGQLESSLTQTMWDVLRMTENDFATVSATESGYGIARTNLGPFTVAVDKVAPYLDGFKVTLRIGNLSSAIAVGAKLKVRWRSAAAQVGQASAAAPAPGYAERNVEILDRLLPGAFNHVDVVVAPATAEQVKVITIGIETDKIEMRRRF